MIVVRYTWHIEAPRYEEVCKLFTSMGVPEAGTLRGVRGYQARTGVTNTLALEWEFDSLGDWERFWEQFAAVPENVEKLRRWDELVPGSGTCEVWDLLDTRI